MAELTEAVRALRELLGRNSGNSNKPPSSDPPGTRSKEQKKKVGRRGGQKGHRGSHRMLVPAEQVEEIVDLYPPSARAAGSRCRRHPTRSRGATNTRSSSPWLRTSREFRRHAVVCPCCRYKTRAAYDPATIPRFSFGPRLMAVVAMLTGVYHLSRRETVRLLWELLGVRMSLGAVSAIEARVSESVEPAVDKVAEDARNSAIKHGDGTTWLRAGVMFSLWVLATTALTAFKILDNGQTNTLRVDLFGRVRGILVSDRATALKFWVMKQRQICWAHLARKFVSFSERDGPACAFRAIVITRIGPS